MGQSTSIMLAATGISFANDWYHTDTPNMRIAMAGLAGVLVLDGIEKVNVTLAKGLAGLVLLGVFLTPIDGEAPAQTVLAILDNKNSPQKSPKPGTGKKGHH